MKSYSSMVVLAILHTTVIGNEYQWYTVKESDIHAISETGATTTFSAKSTTSGLIVDSLITERGCGGAESHIFTFISDLIDGNSYTKWDKIRYTLEFWNSASCWSILGNTHYGNFISNFNTGLIEFDINNKEDRVISNTLFYGEYDGETRRCDNENGNFWLNHGNNGYKGALVVEQRRYQNVSEAGIGIGVSCANPSVTKVRISNIEVGYYVQNCECDGEISLDVAFLLDESGSVTQQEWALMIDWAASVIMSDINDDSYVTLIDYDGHVDQFLEFTKVGGNRINIIAELESNIQDSGSTETVNAIKSSFNIIKDWDNNGNNRSNLLIVLTDDNTNWCNQILTNAFNENDVEILLIGIGSGSWSSKLNCIYQQGGNSFGISSFSDEEFDAIRSEVRSKTCQ